MPSATVREEFLGSPRIELGAAGWEASMLPLETLPQLTTPIFLPILKLFYNSKTLFYKARRIAAKCKLSDCRLGALVMAPEWELASFLWWYMSGRFVLDLFKPNEKKSKVYLTTSKKDICRMSHERPVGPIQWIVYKLVIPCSWLFSFRIVNIHSYQVFLLM